MPEDMQEHWTVYECLKESEDSSTFLVKETATGILCVLKWGRNRQTEFLRNEMEIMKKMADRKLSGIPKAYRDVYKRQHLWNPSYCAITVSDRSRDQVLAYIEGQKEKEKKKA